MREWINSIKMDNAVHMNTRKTCRTCLRVHESRKDLISVFNVDQTFPSKIIKFSEMLASVLSRPVYEHDNLPKRVCVICLQQIRGAFFFKSQAENSHNVLQRQLETSNPVTTGGIKQEFRSPQSCPKSNTISETPLILTPRLIPVDCDVDDVLDDDDMLVEMEPSKLQEPFSGCDVEEDSDEQEIIDYEPSFSDNDSHDIEIRNPYDDLPQTSNNGTSPDSGIIDDACKASSPDNSFHARQLAESQLAEFKQFECQICQKHMVSRQGLLRHQRSHHSESRCVYCRRKFGNRAHLRLHIKFKHPLKYDEFRLNGQTNPVVEVEPIKSIPECSTCSLKFCEKDALYRHHADCDQTCNDCDQTLSTRKSYFEHLAKQHGIVVGQAPALECPFGCLGGYSSEKVLQEHIARSHPEERDESIADTFSEDGESVSNDSKLFSCDICPSQFFSLRSVAQHKAHKHKSTPEVPKTRDVQKYTREEFIDKFMVRKSVDYQRCIPCKRDIHRRSLGLHLRGKHASTKSFLCELCPESFFRIDYRLRHMNNIHPTQLRCEDCDVQFDRRYKYDSHMVQHGVPAKHFKPVEGLDKFDLPSSSMKYIEDSSTYDYSKEDAQRRPSVLSTSSDAPVPMTKDEFVEKYLVTMSDRYVQCTICQQKIMKNSIISHLLWKHATKKQLKCAFCNQRVVKSPARLLHMSRCHPNEYKCFDCTPNQQYAKHEQYASHMLDVHKKKVTSKPSSGEEPDLGLSDVRFICQKNEEEVIEEPEMILIEPDVKLEEVKAEQAYLCGFCPRTFTCSRNLQIHKSHKHKEEVNEALAMQSFDSPTDEMTFEQFRYNFTESISNTDLRCLVCDQTLKKKNIGNHLKARHATTGAFKCAICPEAFYRPEHRMQHMTQTHRGMFLCQTCNIQFYRNSRYSKHMKDQHEIDIDSSDDYEVDISLGDLRFVSVVKKSQQDDEPSIVHEPEEPPEESKDEGMTRDEFMVRYMKIINKDNRHCNACDKNVMTGSMYNHLMRFHAVTLPFKCPFCDLRLERAQYRVRHLQIFHPDDYKCHECGLQFQKHAAFAEHMMDEHNTTVTTRKAKGEEKDLSSFDVKYVVNRLTDEWQEDDNSQMDAPSTSKSQFLKPKIKMEPKDDQFTLSHSIFGHDDSLLTERQTVDGPLLDGALGYADFKSKFVVDVDNINTKCLPCDKIVIKTSVCAHLRYWHSIILGYICEVCGTGFQRSDYRQRHMKSSHPDDNYCKTCDIQFARLTLYKQHMWVSHKLKNDEPELKTKDEIDVPLENMKFVDHIPDDIRKQFREGENETPRRGGRPSTVDTNAINPDGGGLTYKEFTKQYMTAKNGLLTDTMTCNVCNMDMSKFSVKRHLKLRHATSKPYNCELCTEGFQRADVRVQHMETQHKDNFRCFHCNIQFYMSSCYVEHMNETHKMTIRILSGKKASDVDVPIERLRFLPKILYNDDDIQTLTSTSQVALKKVKKNFSDISDDIELTREQFYGKFFRSIKGLSEQKTKCLACNKIFSSKNRKFHAYHNHATSRPLKCELCPSKFFLSSKRMHHMMVRHRDDYKCVECKAQFDRALHFSSHMLSTHQKKVDVPVFDQDEINFPPHLMRYTKKLTAIRALKREKRSLDPVSATELEMEDSSFHFLAQGPPKCIECGEEFDSSRALRIHSRSHTNGSFTPGAKVSLAQERELKALEYVHQCDICEKKFSAAFALTAHKRFKHGIESEQVLRKHKAMKTKYEVECDICDFKSHRRDYVEHHVKAAHKTEFHCRHCSRICSNFNFFMYHLSESHPKSKGNLKKFHKCRECEKGFKSLESLKEHKQNKHGGSKATPENYCSTCCVAYTEAVGLEVHLANHVHKSLQYFLDNFQMQFEDEDEEEEAHEEAPVENGEASTEVEDERIPVDDPFQRMLELKFQQTVEPPVKRARMSRTSAHRLSLSNDDDKLEYLKYLECHNGIYKCGICGKMKAIRKYMLHHLKQHREVPTYTCAHCPEKFVFKKKYEKHLQSHEKPPSEEMNVDEHPKYQETPAAKKEIKCGVCQVDFRLTIMLNRHNTTWHGEDNPDKDLSMSEQKAKKEEPKPEVASIKLLRCKHCAVAFIRASELKEHLKDKHNSVSVDQPMEDEEEAESEAQSDHKPGAFECDKCKLAFQEKKFLDNHQKFFCMHRQAKSESAEAKVINEQ